MTKNEKCFSCDHLTEKGVLVTKTLTDNKTTGDLQRPLHEGQKTEPNYFCTFKRISLNNVIVKNCTNHRFSRNYDNKLVTEEEFSPEEVFKNLPPRQTRINFFK